MAVDRTRRRRLRVVVIGAGLSGIAVAARLQRAGVGEVVVLEKADQVGGTWRDNCYPGVSCDVESSVYELADLPNPGWRRRFAPGAEIQDYVVAAADRLGVRPLVRFGHEVLECRWDDAVARWQLATTAGSLTADVVVAAPGPLSEPLLPELPGRSQFAGALVHTARWDAALDVSGRRVAVIGTGASAIQVIPALQRSAEHVTVFQRTPAWVLPRRDRPVPLALRRLLLAAPALHTARRNLTSWRRGLYGLVFRQPWLAELFTSAARRGLARQVPDPALRRLLTPDYLLGCKRVLLSDDYYPALQQPNVTVVPLAARALTADGVVAADGVAHRADLVVAATGFRVTEYPFADRVTGRDERRLRDAWTPHLHAHLGMAVPGFPNLFLLLGPHAGLGHNSVLLMAEAQADHIVRAVERLASSPAASIEARPEAEERFLAEVERRLQRTVWREGGCASWYQDATGRNTTLWPGSVGSYRRRVRRLRLADYSLRSTLPRSSGDRAPGAPVAGLAGGGGEPSPGVTGGRDWEPPPHPIASPYDPTPGDRVAGLGARHLERLPRWVLAALGGYLPRVVDDQPLDLTVRAVLGVTRQRSVTARPIETPEAARARHRRDVLALATGGPAVAAVEHFVLDGLAHPLRARLYRPPAVPEASPQPPDEQGRGRQARWEREADRRGTAPPPPLLVWFHGGGFVLGDLDTADGPCRVWCQVARQLVLSIDYRLAPEHPFPAAVEDAIAAVRWALRHAHVLGADRVAVGGDSAGGTLAAVAARAVSSDGSELAGQLLVYPATDRGQRRASYELFDGYLLAAADTDRFAGHYYGYRGHPHPLDRDPRVSPLRCADLSGLPPALVATAGFDVLRDEGEAFAQAMADAGTVTRLHREPSLPHGYLHLSPVSTAARQATARLAHWWRWLLAAPSASDPGVRPGPRVSGGPAGPDGPDGPDRSEGPDGPDGPGGPRGPASPFSP